MSCLNVCADVLDSSLSVLASVEGGSVYTDVIDAHTNVSAYVSGQSSVSAGIYDSNCTVSVDLSGNDLYVQTALVCAIAANGLFLTVENGDFTLTLDGEYIKVLSDE